MLQPCLQPWLSNTQASADQHSAIWVNGDKFELSPEAGRDHGPALAALVLYPGTDQAEQFCGQLRQRCCADLEEHEEA